MTFGEVFRFEVEYRLRQPSTWVYAARALRDSVPDDARDQRQQSVPQRARDGDAGVGHPRQPRDARHAPASSATRPSRDVQTRMHSLFYTSPLRERTTSADASSARLVGQRRAGLGVPLGLLLASVMPYMAEGKFGPVQLAAYVQAYVLILLPNVVIIGAFMFAAAALTRQALATYLGGIALFVLGAVAGRLHRRARPAARSRRCSTRSAAARSR